jgi:hypothetical protein
MSPGTEWVLGPDENLDWDPANGYEFTVRPAAVGPGETLVIDTTSDDTSEHSWKFLAWQVIDGPVKPCAAKPI